MKLLSQCLLALPTKILVGLELQILLKFMLAHQVTIARQFFSNQCPSFPVNSFGLLDFIFSTHIH